MELLIYCPQASARTRYIFDFIFKDILLLGYQLSDNRSDFEKYSGPKISYAPQAIAKEIHFKASGLLSENRITEPKIKFVQFGDDKVPFAVENSSLPFDIFSAAFYFVSRYEEYLPFTPDQHLRFQPHNSLQYQLGLLPRPIVDEWAMLLKNILLKAFPTLEFGKKQFQFIPTIDIDRAFLFKSHGLVRNTARFIKALLNTDTERLKKIIKTGINQQKDPFDVYDFLEKTHQKYGVKPYFFFLLSHQGHKDFDVNIHPNDALLQDIIRRCQKTAQVGIHPSYASNGNRLHIRQEKMRLEAILGRKVSQSRQHFLKIHLPKTYIELINEGISDDYSMGYAAEPGFRAGTCTPFYWYDLQLEKQSSLRVHPFAIMDATLRRYLKLQPQDAPAIIEQHIKAVKAVSGTFYSLWHNESLSETAEWKGWKFVYEYMLKEAQT
jgi:hypothetical protein